MPYSMEYALPSQHYHTTADITPNELYPVQLPAGQESILPQTIGQESLNTDSSNNLVSSLANANAKSSQQQIGNAKVKRSDDLWTGN